MTSVKFIAFWDEDANEYKWYDKPEAAKGGQPIEVSKNGSRPVVFVWSGKLAVRDDGEAAEIYEAVAENAHVRRSKYFDFEPAKGFGTPKMPPVPVDPAYMKRRHRLLNQLRRGY